MSIRKSSILPAVVYGTDPAEYHAIGREFQRGDKGFIMSRGALVDFAKCPGKWVRGAVEDRDEEATKAMKWGALVDTLFLTDGFKKLYAVAPLTYMADGKRKGDAPVEKPWNRNANYCSDWEDAAKADGQEVVKEATLKLALEAVKRLQCDPVVDEYRRDCETQVQACCEYVDGDTGIVVQLKCLLDIVPKGNSLADLKCYRNASNGIWPKIVKDDNLHWQGAIYTDVFNVAADENRNEFRHIISENTFPFEVGRRIISDDFMEMGRMEYRAALARYCHCLETGFWPGLDDDQACEDNYQGWTITQPASWMVQP